MAKEKDTRITLLDPITGHKRKVTKSVYDMILKNPTYKHYQKIDDDIPEGGKVIEGKISAVPSAITKMIEAKKAKKAEREKEKIEQVETKTDVEVITEGIVIGDPLPDKVDKVEKKASGRKRK